MEPPRYHGPELHIHDQPAINTEDTRSLVSASPGQQYPDAMASQPPHHESKQTVTTTMAPPYTTVGHFSFGPATQQTIVTTTTTTTISFPPLQIKPPRDLYERDPKQYPLAFSPTPSSIKRFGFEVGGRRTVYKEAEDANASLHDHHQQQRLLQASNGTIRTEATSSQENHMPNRLGKQALRPSASKEGQLLKPRKRSPSPPSLAEAAELAALQNKRKRPRSLLHRTYSGLSYDSGLEEKAEMSRHRIQSGPSPVTPDTDAGTDQNRILGNVSANFDTTRTEAAGAEGSKSTNRVVGDESRVHAWFGPSIETLQGRTRDGRGHAAKVEAQSSGATATPPIAETDLEPVASNFSSQEEYRRPALPGILTSSQQDASLPSPSLSPVTAAANLARSHPLASFAATENNEDEDSSEVSAMDLEETMLRRQSGMAIAPHLNQQQNGAVDQARARRAPPSLMDVPTMIDSFDAMPSEMQTYVIYQMLRRCAKNTLQTVAEVVNPALKCDPFNVLPVELGLQITKFLDAQSLCRASQVSKKWRHLINSDERAWKELIERDGFQLPEGRSSALSKRAGAGRFQG
ncbi:SCF ubiquitin ligase complex subunit cdc4 [Taxawa tesnikishii (nom. ined.)]|nr:SCF ubiquitin ligase complex subunit cdc4 [Dothideales sp. JES 119]